LQWYAEAWSDLSLRRSVQASLVVAFWSAALSVLIGSALGYVIVRHPIDRVRRFLAVLTYTLLIVPESVIGVSLLLFYAVTGGPLGTATLATDRFVWQDVFEQDRVK
jgi:ABC-type spermidine/putrescine transport system permease subunit II